MKELVYSINHEGTLQVAEAVKTPNGTLAESKKAEDVHLVTTKDKNVIGKFKTRYTLEVIEELETIMDKAIPHPQKKVAEDAKKELDAFEPEEKNLESTDKLLKLILNANIDPKDTKKHTKSQRTMNYAMVNFMCENKDVKSEEQDWGLILKLVAVFRSKLAI